MKTPCAMEKWVLCLFFCVQSVVGQFGFFQPRESSLSQINTILNPTRIRNRVTGLLHLQHEGPNDQAYVYPFNNRPYYGRPGIINDGTPSQFGVPNRNFQDPYAQFQAPYQNGFPNPQNGFQDNFNTNTNGDGLTVIPGRQDGSFGGSAFQDNTGNRNTNGDGLTIIPGTQDGSFGGSAFQDKTGDRNTNGDGFIVIPGTQEGSFGGSAFQDNTGNTNTNGDGLIVIPGTQEGSFGGSAFQDKTGDRNSNGDGLIVIPGSQEGSFGGSAFQDKTGDRNSNGDGLIVIPGPQEGSFGGSGFQDKTGGTTPNGDGLIVIPGTVEGQFGGSSNGFVFPDSHYEITGEYKATEATTKAAEPVTEPATSEYLPLTPVPSTDSRNNFNFGPSGIFQETCRTVQNGVGSCVQVSECQPYMKLIQQSRSNPNALRILRQAHCGFQGDQPKVCCPRPGIPTAPPPTLLPPTLPPTTTTQEPILIPEEPTEPKAEPKTASVLLPEAPECGFSNASLGKVVGGVNASLGDFPWMALLGYKPRRGAGARWLCGGSLVSARHVLTAAHCIHTREDDLYVVRLGELDLAREDEGATPVDVLIQRSIKHDSYDPKSFTNDIGILVLSRNVQFTDLIKPICIPRSSELRARSYENYNPLIAGWGDTEFRGPSATQLQVLQLPVVSNEFCAQAYSAYKEQVIDHRVLCAGYKRGGKDACQGDSGGPLMQPIWNSQTLKTYFYQIGVVSYGKKCAEAGFPGVYTRVTDFVPWIEKTVANN